MDRFDPSEELNWYPDSKETNKLNQSQNSIREFYKLDYLYFWLFEKSLITSSHFEEKYLEFIDGHIKIKPSLIASKNPTDTHPNSLNKWYFANYNRDLFLKASSKFLLAQFHQSQQAYVHKVICSPREIDIQDAIENSGKIIIKNEFGFAGRGNCILSTGQKFLGDTSRVVLETFLDRVLDFSILWIDEKKIIYENIVTKNGQYQGSLFNCSTYLNIESFLLEKRISKKQVIHFLKYLELLEIYWKKQLNCEGDLIPLNGAADFFIFKDEKNFLHIHPCCEFNPRWSMGRVAFFLFNRLKELNSEFLKWQTFKLHFCNNNEYLDPDTKETKKVLVSPKSRKPLVLSVNFMS